MQFIYLWEQFLNQKLSGNPLLWSINRANQTNNIQSLNTLFLFNDFGVKKAITLCSRTKDDDREMFLLKSNDLMTDMMTGIVQ